MLSLPFTVLAVCLYRANSQSLAGYGAGGGDGGDYSDYSGGSLEDTIPGTPGLDYPILAEVPDTGFSCDGRVEGGKYADPGAECQAFHFCALGDTEGGLLTYSFLCPNGTIFNQQYFICDWWFNVDCSQAEALYGVNDELAAQAPGTGGGGGDYSAPRGGGGGGGGAARRPQTGYGAPGK